MGLTCNDDAYSRAWNTLYVISDTALFPQDTILFPHLYTSNFPRRLIGDATAGWD